MSPVFPKERPNSAAHTVTDESKEATTVFAKTTRPEIGNIVGREALFARLDGTAGRTVAWISGPAGAGKSTLAASYVEARGYQSAWYQIDPDDDDIATFFHYLRHAARRIVDARTELPPFGALRAENIASYSRTFFRQMFGSVRARAALVLDNLNELPADGWLLRVLEAGLSQVPRHCCAIVTGRSEPPSTLARMRAGGEMVCIGADDLRLTPEELAEVASLRGKPLTPEAAARLQERTQGWAAGVVLMLEHAKIAGHIAEIDGEATPKVIFDYLAGEIFDRFPPETQHLLLRTACLPRMTAEVAQALSGVEKAGRILLNLVHNDYFVSEVVGKEGRIFQLHPLLRDFIRSRTAAELPDAVGAAALGRAAALLRDTGQFEDAVSLLVECKDWGALAAIAIDRAGTMLTNGRRETLAGWLELLPAELIEDNPRLLQAFAESRMHTSPRTARRQFEKAFTGFRGSSDIDGMIRSCCGVIDATILEFDDLASLDQWMEELLRLSKLDADCGSAAAAALVHAMLLRDPGNRALGEWLAGTGNTTSGARAMADGLPRIAMARAMAALLRGDFGTAEAISGGIGDDAVDPATKIGLALAAALHHLLDGEFGRTRQSAREGIVTADAEGIDTYDGWLRILLAVSALGEGDLEAVRDELRTLEARDLRRGDRAVLHFLRGWLAAIEGEAASAQREMKSSLVLAVEVGIPWVEWFGRVAMAQVLGAAGSHREAEAQVRSAKALVERLASPLLRVATLLMEAAGGIQGGDEAAALAPLRAALSLSRENGFRHVVGLGPHLVAELCAAALQNDIEPEYVCNLVRGARLAPPAAALRLREWPWPFKIGTLGGFTLLRGTKPIEFSAKGPGRPVELLKVLVALGGENVRVDQLADALWPHVDADYAYKSFTATLYRLRTNIFESDDAVVLRDGRLSLNAAAFWVDAWALEHLIAEMDTQLREPDSQASQSALQSLVEEALALYRGPFLPDEAEQPSYIGCREQIRIRLLRVLARAAKRWTEAGHADAAIDCYLRCIDADELCEAFYCNLILCHQRNGEIAEALSVYERLRMVLAARLKSLPSPETQAVYASLRTSGGSSATS